MVPVSRFFEYGIAALLGVAIMMALGVWALVSESARSSSEGSLDEEGTAIPDFPLYKKAA